MKRTLFIATLFFMFFIIPSNVKAEKVGPIIKGFQLGQTLDEVKIAAEKFGLILKPVTDPDARMYITDYFCIQKDKELEEKPLAFAMIKFRINDDNTVRSITFEDNALTTLFNATGRRKGFLQAFLNNCDGLNTLEPVQEQNQFTGGISTSYRYISDQEGWMIVIFTSDSKEATGIKLVSIEKTGDFNF